MTEKVGTGSAPEEIVVDEVKREFMKKFGKYAATAPLGMYLLLGAGASKAQASSTSSTYISATFTATLKDDQVIYVHGPDGNLIYTVDPSNSFYSWFLSLLQ
jgi:hypothetical protein